VPLKPCDHLADGGLGKRAAVGDVAGTGNANAIGTGSASGAGAASGAGQFVIDGTSIGTAGGVGTASAVGQSIAVATGTASGSGSATADSATVIQQRQGGASSGRFHRNSRYWIRVYDDEPPAAKPKKRDAVVVQMPRPVAKPITPEPYDDTDDIVALLLLAA
jgi:hypothetical protein